MGFFSWFDSKVAAAFGKAMAELIVRELPVGNTIKERKFAIKAEKTLIRVDRELVAFKKKNTLNTYQKAKLGNAFLWTLKESGVEVGYADELTEWLTTRL
ncbi:MAG: hypothetical protein ABIP46_04625 [Polaromonas sp.]